MAPWPTGYLFFAEDVFGVQFSLKGSESVPSTRETGEADAMASSVDG
jgi:hypothetical protein